jgi:hypothetical protein
MIRVVHTRPSCWGRKFKSDRLDMIYVPIGHPHHRLRKGEPAADNMGEVMTGQGEHKLIRAFKEHQPHVFLYWPHFGNFGPKLLKKLRVHCKNTVFLHGSGNHVIGQHGVDWYVHKFRRHIDAIVTTTTCPKRKALFKRWCRWVGTLYNFGFDPELFTAPNVETEYDCFFGGGDSVREGKRKGKFPWSRFRHDLIRRTHKEHALLLRGGGTWKDHNIPAQSGIMDSVPYFRDMQRAKIILGTYHDDLERRYSKRTIYGGASGRLFMTRYITKMEKDFTNHVNIVWFHTVNEGMDLIKYYLGNDKAREKVASQTREHFIKHHSWAARLRDFEKVVAEMLRALRAGKGKGRGAGNKR